MEKNPSANVVRVFFLDNIRIQLSSHGFSVAERRGIAIVADRLKTPKINTCDT
jgi:hypothetical protein